MSKSEEHVLQQCGYFHSYVVEQMIRYWVETEPEPDALINQLVSGWRERATGQFQSHERAMFEKTGIISTEGEYFQSVLDEAERRVRLKLFGQREKPAEAQEEEPPGRTM